MKNNIWAKTLLKAYRYLERISDAIDTLVERTAVNSFYVAGNNFASGNVTNVANKIINLSQRKVTLINLKLMIEEALSGMDKSKSQMLVLKYFDGEQASDMAAAYNLPLRTYFRHLSKAEEDFMTQLRAKGYSESRLLEMIKGESWLISMYERLDKSGEGELSKREVEKAAEL